MRKIKIDWNYWVIRFLFIIAVIVSYKVIANYEVLKNVLENFISVLSPFIIGFVIAYLLNGAQKRVEVLIEKISPPFLKKAKRGLSVLIVYLVLIGIIFVSLNYVIPIIINNIIDLISMLPTFYNYLLEVVENLESQGTLDFIPLEQILTSLSSTYGPDKLLSQWNQALTSLGAFTIGVSSMIFNAFLSFIISIYALLFKDSILEFVSRASQKIFSHQLYERMKHAIQTTNNVFYKFISSQFLDACVVGILSMILLNVMNVKFAVTLALLLGACNMIPYFGSIFASVVIGIICFFTGGFTHAITVLLALIILQQIDGNIIGPRIMSGALNLNPIIIIISISVGGSYFGVLGMFLAVPAAALIKIFIDNWLEKPAEKQIKNPSS